MERLHTPGRQEARRRCRMVLPALAIASATRHSAPATQFLVPTHILGASVCTSRCETCCWELWASGSGSGAGETASHAEARRTNATYAPTWLHA